MMGLLGLYKLPQVLIKSQRVVQGARKVPASRAPGAWGIRKAPVGYESNVTLPAITEFRGKLYANVDGQPDNGSGDFTGVNAALIERPADVLQHLLYTYAGQALAKIERGSSVFGSLVDARALLKTWRNGDMKVAFGISDDTDVRTAINWIASSCASWPYLDRFTDKWKLVPWRSRAE